MLNASVLLLIFFLSQLVTYVLNPQPPQPPGCNNEHLPLCYGLMCLLACGNFHEFMTLLTLSSSLMWLLAGILEFTHIKQEFPYVIIRCHDEILYFFTSNIWCDDSCLPMHTMTMPFNCFCFEDLLCKTNSSGLDVTQINSYGAQNLGRQTLDFNLTLWLVMDPNH